MATTAIKCVVIGDGAVGKTCLLHSYSKNTFPKDYVPTVFDNYTAHLMRNNEVVQLNLWDTAGQTDYDNLRPLSYAQTDVFLVCFDISNRNSFLNITQRWLPEINQKNGGTPIVIVGTKSDFRDERPADELISEKEAQDLLKTMSSGKKVWEVSALTQTNVKELFDDVVDIVFQSRNETVEVPEEGCSCVVL